MITMSIFGSLILTSCSGGSDKLDIKDNIKNYNYTAYSELSSSNTVKFDLEAIIKACNQNYIDAYMENNQDACDDVKGYLKFRNVYDNIDIEFNEISLDVSILDNCNSEYLDTSSIRYLVTFTAYTDLDILDCMSTLEYNSSGELVHFECIGI